MDYDIQENEINLMELFQLILQKWWLILIFTVVSVGVSAYISLMVMIPMYEASSTLFIGKEATALDNFDISFSELQVDSKLVSDYRELIQTRLVTEEVIADLGLETSTAVLVRQLSIGVISDSRFIHLSFKDANPELARDITNKLSEVLVEKANDILGVKNVQVVDRAITPSTPISPDIKKNLAISGLIGFALGVFCIVVLHLFDNTVKNEDDLERLGLVVLGVVPKY